MEWGFSEEQLMLQKMARDFAEKELRPLVDECEKQAKFPKEFPAKMGNLGIWGMLCPEQYGGAGQSGVNYMICMEEIARIDASAATCYSTENLVMDTINHWAAEDIKRKYLPRLASGKSMACFSMTEPNAGSDLTMIQSTAQIDGDQWVLNGKKIFASHANWSDIALVLCSTDKKAGHKGLTTFIIDAGSTKGFSIGKTEEKLGQRAMQLSEIVLEDCRIPKENTIGQAGQGFYTAVVGLDMAKVAIGMLGVGLARRAYEEAMKYAHQRVQFKQPVINFQGIQWKFVDMAMQIEVARSMIYRTASVRDRGLPFTKEASMAKLFSSEMCRFVTHQALQVFGAHGYIKDNPMEKFYRDQRLLEIYEGTSEINRDVIAGRLIREYKERGF